MGVRALRARIVCDRQTLDHLWRTHCVFNERLRTYLSILFAMRRGERGDTAEQRDFYRKIAGFVLARDAKDAPDLLNAISLKTSRSKGLTKKTAILTGPGGVEETVNGDKLAQVAETYRKQGVLAYDKHNERNGLPDSLFQPLVRDAVAYISGHAELARNWEKAHEEWLEERTKWEAAADHKKYLAVRPRFEAFEETAGGNTGKRRGRWHLYLKWLAGNPDLAAWRGDASAISPLGAQAQARIAKAKATKKAGVEAEEFWKANPELAALDRLHGDYERRFVRRRKTKKNPDGFDHRPTFTQPHPVLHPRWVLFNAPQTSPSGYRALELPRRADETGSVCLRLLTGAKMKGEFSSGWTCVSFQADPRLMDFAKTTVKTTFLKGKRKGEAGEKPGHIFIDRQLGGMERPAQISGAKLIFKHIKLGADGSLKSATPYLDFACTVKDIQLTESARAIAWPETGEATKAGKRRKKKTLPRELVTCAVDLGLRHLGFLTLAVREEDGGADPGGGLRVIRCRNQWLDVEEQRGRHAGRRSAGPDLAKIRAHKWEIRRLRRLRGKPVKGEESHMELQSHITHMGEDRFKKAARAIVNFAVNAPNACGRDGELFPRADVLLVEKLAGFIPDAERERGINRALAEWNRGQTVARVKEVARDAGLKVYEVYPGGTSQCCCKCGALGRRYSVTADPTNRIRFGEVEKLFACPNADCPGRDPHRSDRPFTCNSDYNASVNLHRVFVLGDVATNAFRMWQIQKADQKRMEKENIESGLRPALHRLHGLPEV